MRLAVVLVAWVCTLSLAVAQPAQSPPQQSPAPSGGRRVALVIGVNAYESFSRLDNPLNDARLMAETLRATGFTLVSGGPVNDPDKARFDRAILEFGRAADGADVALFYYSGHGAQIDGRNWLAPTNATLRRPQEISFSQVDADTVLAQMTGARSKLNIMILDACRDNPFVPTSGKDGAQGLAPMRAPAGTVISYATQPGNTASQGPVGGNSPYVIGLATAMRTPGLDLFRVFNNAALHTRRLTNGVQLPYVTMSPIEGDFYFISREAPAVIVADIPGPGPLPGPKPGTPVPLQSRPVAKPVTTGPVSTNPGTRPAPREDASFWLVNLAGRTVTDLRASPVGDRQWGVNRLGDAHLVNGARFGVKLPEGGCHADLRVTYEGSEPIEERDVETCAVQTMVLGGDGRPAAANPSFTLQNRTGRPATNVRVSLSSEREWGRSRLAGGASLNDGGRLNVTMPIGQSCSVDIRLDFDIGEPIERYKIDTCAITSYAVR